MKIFPDAIASAMRTSGAAATCVPVQLNAGDWEAALFVQVAGPECRQDRRILKTAATPVPARLATELLAHSSAAVIMLRLEILTVSEDPLAYEILLAPGSQSSHYETLKLLARQTRLCWFFGDNDYRLLRAQEQTIEQDTHERFEALSREAFAHDSLIRMAGQYDCEAALAEIANHYALREGAGSDRTH